MRDPGPNGEGAEDRRLLAVEEEFSHVLKMVARDGSVLSETLRRGWDNGNLATLTRHEPLKATGAHVSLLGHVTREELQARLTALEVANGLANRMMFLVVRRTRLLSDGGASLSSLDSQVRRVKHCLAEARHVGEVKRTAEAADLWDSIYRHVESMDDAGMIGALTARASAHQVRLALIYALLDGVRVIDVEHVAAAYEFWRYADASVRHLFRATSGDSNADRIVEALRGAGVEGMARSEMHALFGRHLSSAELDRSMTVLEGHGLVVTVPQPTGGRPVLRSFLSEESALCETSLPPLSVISSLGSLSSQPTAS